MSTTSVVLQYFDPVILQWYTYQDNLGKPRRFSSTMLASGFYRLSDDISLKSNKHMGYEHRLIMEDIYITVQDKRWDAPLGIISY